MQAQAAAVPELAEGRIKGSVFEGLFVNVLHVPAGSAFARALCEVGYDLAHPVHDYPTTVLQAALEVAAHHALPHLSVHEAQRELGKRFIEGFFKTLAGRALGLLVPVLGPEGIMRQSPRFFGQSTQGTTVTVQEEAPRRWRFELRDAHPLCDFDAGIMEAALERAGVKPTVRVRERAAQHFVLDLAW